MNIHIALYKWKESVTQDQINNALKQVEALAGNISGIVEISTGINTSKYSQGYTHVILVRADNQAAIDGYRNHPDHKKVANIIDDMEDNGIGVDFVTNSQFY
jgi:hypothetical protein